MIAPLHEVEDQIARAFERHCAVGGEQTLLEAYEVGRAALARDVGVLDVTQALWRVVLPAATRGEPAGSRAEGFVIECLSPFEMAHRGAREANDALRRLDERREEEIRRIARELHDQAGQVFALLHQALDALHPHVAPTGVAHLERSFALLRQAEGEVRRLSHELRPVLLEDLGLLPALRFLAEGVTRRSGIEVAVEGSGVGRLSNAVETVLYRGVQEALNNVVRHSLASHARIELVRDERAVTCRIRDDGRGFDPAALRTSPDRRGIGLDGIRERLAPVAGRLEVRSQPGYGTELEITIPLEVPHA